MFMFMYKCMHNILRRKGTAKNSINTFQMREGRKEEASKVKQTTCTHSDANDTGIRYMSSGDGFTMKMECVFMCMRMYTLSILKTMRMYMYMYVHYIEHLLPVIVCGLFNISVGERHLPSDANILHHLPEDTLINTVSIHTCRVPPEAANFL